jgi:hypothetical protein
MRPARSSYRVDLNHGSSASLTATFHGHQKDGPDPKTEAAKGEIFRDGLPVWGPNHRSI